MNRSTGVVFPALASAMLVFAYIDPGTGSYLPQLLIAGLVGGAFAVKIFWKNIRASLARLFGKKRSSESNDDSH